MLAQKFFNVTGECCETASDLVRAMSGYYKLHNRVSGPEIVDTCVVEAATYRKTVSRHVRLEG